MSGRYFLRRLGSLFFAALLLPGLIAFSSTAKRTTLREAEVVRATFIHERKCARRGAQDVFAEIIFSLARTELRAIQPTDRIPRVVQ